MRILLLCVFCSSMLTLGLAQKSGSPTVNGFWRGKITQDKGGIRPEYGMEMYLTQKGTKVTGRSFVYFDKVYAEMALEGEFKDGKTLVFKETKITAYKRLDGMEWCLKGAVLSLVKSGNAWRLEGPWTGNTSFGPCIPGKILLKKSIPRV
ncbi:MAG: hypothetical protein ACK4TA_06330 [Saprospiraceae bacterium]